mmetsp:Transcript_27852/g.93679  ORF Transcript_27852/g.93679 Transcript_27852/m.93679 type:complete len:204 (+) Transcript_27852:269-880(+)
MRRCCSCASTSAAACSTRWRRARRRSSSARAIFLRVCRSAWARGAGATRSSGATTSLRTRPSRPRGPLPSTRASASSTRATRTARARSRAAPRNFWVSAALSAAAPNWSMGLSWLCTRGGSRAIRSSTRSARRWGGSAATASSSRRRTGRRPTICLGRRTRSWTASAAPTKRASAAPSASRTLGQRPYTRQQRSSSRAACQSR